MFNWEESTDQAKEKNVCNMLCGAVIPLQIIDSGWTVILLGILLTVQYTIVSQHYGIF